MRVEKKNKEHVKEAALLLLQVYFYEWAFFELAMVGALKPRPTDSFIDKYNTLVRKLVRDLEELVNQYRQQPPIGPFGPYGGQP